MNKTTATLAAAAFAALSVPALAMADKPQSNPHKPATHHAPAPSSPNGANSASAQCRAERSAMGEANFKRTYGTNRNGSNAFGRCVSRRTAQSEARRRNASRACRAQQADASFSTTHGGKTFDQYYGTNSNRSNAFGRCVSTTARAGG